MIRNYNTICYRNLKISVVRHSKAEFTTLIESDGVGQLASIEMRRPRSSLPQMLDHRSLQEQEGEYR